jgi:predicted ATPase
MMIEQIALRNYKSILDAEIELGQLNVLIGRNGSGKSNFLSFFHLLNQGAHGHLSDTINTMGGISEVIHYKADTFEWELTFKELGGMSPVYYRGKIKRRGTFYYNILFEELEHLPYLSHSTRSKFLTFADGRVRVLSAVQDEKDEERDDVSDQELFITQLRDRRRYPMLFELETVLKNWQHFRGFGSDALDTIRSSQNFRSVEPLKLEADGSNLISILQQLANQPQYQEVSDKLNQLFRVTFSDFAKFDIPIDASNKGSLNYRSHDFSAGIPAISMSDGQLRFLGLILLLLLPNSSLIPLDEPEIGLHPQMLAILAEALEHASQHTQIIISTHSPQLIDALKPENIILVDREEGNTSFRRPDAEQLQRWLERYTLGRLWTMGRLGV